jgi:multicomponent Na+:H+ antiporter subunit G
MTIFTVLAVILILGGLFFFSTATIGLLRFPDFYTRLHATGKGDTLAVFLSLIGIAIYEGITLTGLKVLLIALFMFLAQPTATHAISRAGIRSGYKHWTRKEDAK